ncbi:MAG: amidohydrolase family protein [Alphaproteobacteria bacterium]|nr:amidohydrolase family protein [Alphaproteobacteria bacterium]
MQKSLILALAFLATSVFAAHAAEPTPKLVAFVNAAVVPMDTERVVPGQTVVVADGKIVAIGPAASVRVPPEALRIDATGRYLMPALADMHVHLLGESWNAMFPPNEQRARKDVPFERFMFPYIANGVTTVQVLMATPEDLAVREQVRQGKMIGPRMILAKMIDGPGKSWPPPLNTWVATPAEAREAVLRAKRDGYDKMKVYSFLTKETYDAVIATAREVDMEVMGHVPNALSVEYVIEKKQKAIAHSEELAKHTKAYDAANVDHYSTLLAKSGTWMIPTLVTTHTFLDLFENMDAVFNRPGGQYHNHPMQRGAWTFMIDNLYKPIPAEHRTKLRDAYVKFQRPLTKAALDKGAKLLAGSDAMMPGLVAGFSLHGELQEFVDIGFTPYQALRTATTNPFEYLGENDKGTIALGKQSDLLLLNANPLQNVTAASKISGVLMRGRWLPAEEIDNRMKQIAAGGN